LKGLDLPWLSAFVPVALAGAPLAAHPAFRRLGLAARAALAAAAGAVLLSTLMTLASLAGVSWAPLPLLAATAAIAAAFRLALRGRSALEDDPDTAPLRPRRGVRVLYLGLSGLAVAAAFDVTAAGGATSVDMVLQWGPKAQAYAAARGFDAALLADPFNWDLNRSYPPLVPEVEAFASILSNRPDFPWRTAPLAFPFLLGILALALDGLLARGRHAELGAAGAALTVAVLAYSGAQFEVAGNGDAPFWFFELSTAALLTVSAASERATCVAGGLLLAGAATTKLEGLPFALASIVLFVLTRGRRRRPGAADLAFLALPAAVALGAWFAFGASRGLFSGYGVGPAFEIHWERTGEILRTLGAELGRKPWPYAAAALFFAASLRARKRVAPLPLLLAGGLAAFLVFGYFHGAPDPREWIVWSAGRVFAPLAALVVLSAAAATDSRSSPNDEFGVGLEMMKWPSG
jgi:hypothetical protein